ncbi:MAG TPA: PSD1 and planctomycete cytochrome C domain-containing protein [Pirellula sp.]|nr:PSD1 and planctomycete cytochrome C domain-containing protein [Pirellula sp.]
MQSLLYIVSWFAIGIAWESSIDFSREIKPILVAHCIKCHDEKKHESGLRLDQGAGVLAGGDGGSIVLAGNSRESRLLKILRGEDQSTGKMPPEGPALTEEQIVAIANWIDSGATIPQAERTLTASSNHWSFQSLKYTTPPEVAKKTSIANPIDEFVLAKLESCGIAPSPQAEPPTLIRRLSLDLRGVAPSPEEVIAFEQADSPVAFEQLVDRYLASPEYGERWGRHWLDLARYADSNGFTRDFERQVWKYRDWVIQAINAGMPFDQFTIEQLAGDMLPEPKLGQLIATGFHRNTLTNDEGGTDPEQFRVDAIADRVDTTGLVYLGLTLGCARCHHHKYDPISQREYYQIFAFFNNCDEPQIDAPTQAEIDSGIVGNRNTIRSQIAEREKQLAEQQTEFLTKQIEWEATITPKLYRTLPGPTQVSLEVKPARRDEGQKKLVAELFKTTDEARNAFPLVKQIADLQAASPVIATSLVLRERVEGRKTRIHRRGNFLDEGDTVQSNVPAVLPPLNLAGQEAKRIDFAKWLVDPVNPLTPRVTVNRYWMHFFGRGLVETENDFGAQGAPPTHPELMDWLAFTFVESGWDIKSIHRLIVNSATYRQSSRNRPELAETDPVNKWLARQSRVRLDAEIVRDSALSASGLLTHKLGGPSVHPPQPDGVYQFTQDSKPWKTDVGEDRYRRGMYTFIWRSSPYPALGVFDAADANTTCTRRIRSNTPLQSLTLANDIQFIECARSLAHEILSQTQLGPEARAALLFRRCLVRLPSTLELQRLVQLIEMQRVAFSSQPMNAAALVERQSTDSHVVELAAWTAAARVLMNLDEFVTRE